MNHSDLNDQKVQNSQAKILYDKLIATKPMKPLNSYFKFRQQKIIELRDDENRNINIKEAWEKLDEEAKEEMNKQYKTELEDYNKKIQLWTKQLEKFSPAFHRQRPNRRIETIFLRNNNESSQQTGCWRCNELSKQKASLEQQLIRLQQNLQNMEQKFAIQSSQTQKYKSSYEQLLQLLKKKQNP